MDKKESTFCIPPGQQVSEIIFAVGGASSFYVQPNHDMKNGQNQTSNNHTVYHSFDQILHKKQPQVRKYLHIN